MDKLILIADDEPHITALLGRSLSNAGYLVTTAKDGVAALESMEVSFPDVLVTDFHMPNLDAEALCEKVNAKFESSIQLIIVMTGRTDPRIRRWSKQFKNLEFAEKPLSPRALVNRIDRHFCAQSNPQRACRKCE